MVSAACGGLPEEHRVVTEKDGKILIPLSEVSDGRVHFYTYKKSGKRINFFVRTDAGGKLSSCFDACYTCYKKKKGYRQEGSDIICNECDMKFPLADEKWDERDSCSPIFLKSSVEGASLVIDAEHLERGKKLF
jgi:uncharacterized membrane protein